jgi:hypothetical protein
MATNSLAKWKQQRGNQRPKDDDYRKEPTPKPKQPTPPTADILRPVEKPKPPKPAQRPPQQQRPSTADVLRPTTPTPAAPTSDRLRPRYQPEPEERDRDRPQRPQQRPPPDILRPTMPTIGPRERPLLGWRPEQDEPERPTRRTMYDVGPSNVGLTRDGVDTGVPGLQPGGPRPDTRFSTLPTPDMPEVEPYRQFLPNITNQWRPQSDAMRASSVTGAGGGRGLAGSIDVTPGLAAGQNILGAVPGMGAAVGKALGNLINPAGQGGGDIGLGGIAGEQLRNAPGNVGNFINPTGASNFGEWLSDQTQETVKQTVQKRAEQPGFQYADQQVTKRAEDGQPGIQRITDPLQNVMDYNSAIMKPLITTPVPGVNMSVGQALSSFGSALNQTLNPLNPNARQATKSTWFDTMWDSPLPNPLAPFQQTANLTAQNWQGWQQVNADLAQMSPVERDAVNVALSNTISGPQQVGESINQIQNRDRIAAGLQYQASRLLGQAQDIRQQAEQAGHMTDEQATQIQEFQAQAARAGAAANEWKNKSAVDIVDSHTNPWASFIEGAVLDPTNLVPLGIVGDMIGAARRSRMFFPTAERAISRLDDALKSADNMLAGGLSGTKAVDPLAAYRVAGAPPPKAGKVDVRRMWEKITPWAIDQNSLATGATEQLWAQAVNLLKNANTKESARRILQTWIDNPQQLIKGLAGTGLDPAMLDEGLLKVGGGVLSATDNVRNLARARAVLKSARDTILNIPALQGTDNLNPQVMLAELDNAIYNGARTIFGLDAMNLPAGAVNLRLVKDKAGLGVIEYIDKKGKVVQSLAAEFYPHAKATYQELRKTIQAAGAVNKGRQVINFIPNAQRAILSDMWLNLRPAHWIRNAASATATLMTDGNYSLRPVPEIVEEWNNKMGGFMPTRRLEEGQVGEAGGPNWMRKLWPKNNPYASIMEALNRVWSGSTEIAGAIPFGENAFRFKSFDAAARRALAGTWASVVQGDYGAALRQIGVDDDALRTILNTAIEQGVKGNKQTMAEAMRRTLASNTLPFTLKELGLPDELLAPENWKAVNDILTTTLPDGMDAAAANLRRVFQDEITKRARIINQAPPQVWPDWTDHADTQDGAQLIDKLVGIGRQMGLDAQEAQKRANELVKPILDGVTENWENYRQAIAANNNPNAMNLAMDTLVRISDLKEEAREALDTLTKQTIKAGDPTWDERWKEAARIYQGVAQRTQEIFAESRTQLDELLRGGQPQAQGYDWQKVLQRYVDYDEQAVQQARTAGLGLQSPQDSPEWTQTINAGREYLDHSMTELFEAFRQNPNMPAMDMIADTLKKIDTMGAQTAAYLAPYRQKALEGTLSWTDYFNKRNEAWNGFFDNGVLYNNSMRRVIYISGLTEQYADALRWTDEYLGGEMRLIGPANRRGKKKVVGVVDDPEKGKTIDYDPKGVPVLSDFWHVQGPDGKIQIIGSSAVPEQVRQNYSDLMEMMKGAGDAAGVDGYTVGKMMEGLDYFGVKPGSNLYDFLSSVIRQSRKGGGKAPEIGEVLGVDIQKLGQGMQRILDNLPQILQGKPNKLTPAQRQAAVDALTKMMPTYDNVLASAVWAGEKAADFALLNYGRRRNIDAALGFMFPYHYFWSRSGQNWLKRMAQQPQTINFMHEYYRAMGLENQQSGADQSVRTSGTWPNPLAQLGVGQERMNDPLPYLLPIGNYMTGNEMIDPEDASTETGKWIMRFLKYTPGVQPAMAAGVMRIMDEVAPRTDGRSWLDSQQLGDYLPLYSILGQAYQGATGDTGPSGFLGWNDEWAQGRIGRNIAVNEEDPQKARWGEDIAFQKQYDEPPLPEQPDYAQGVYEEGARQTGGEQFWSKATNYMLGVGTQPMSDEEMELREMSRSRPGLGYSPENPYGTRAAMTQNDDKLSPWWNYGQLYPGSEAESMRPGMVAANKDLSQQRNGIYERMNQAVEQHLLTNPGATKKEVEAIREPFRAELDKLGKFYSGGGGEGSFTRPGGMTPAERARWELERVMKSHPEGYTEEPRHPGDEATDEAKNAYYIEHGKYNEAKYNLIEQEFGSFLNPQQVGKPGGPQLQAYGEADNAWREELRKLVQGQYASELDRRYGLRFSSAVEQTWNDYATLEGELTSAEFKAQEDRVRTKLGNKTLALYQQYVDLEKGKPRSDFGRQHPEVYTAMAVAYNPEEYDQARELFENDIWQVVQGYPPHPGDNASEAQLNAYYDKIDAYEAAHPNALPGKMWIKGRTLPDGMPEGYHRDAYGVDYAEAERLFTPGIWQELANVPAYDEATKGRAYYDYLRAHPNVYGYREWVKELKGMTPEEVMARYPMTEDAATRPDLYTGERPVGSGRSPIGGPASEPSTIWPQMGEQSPDQWNNWRSDLSQSWQTAPQFGQPATGTSPATDTETPVSTTPATKNTKTAQDYINASESFQKSKLYEKGSAEFAAASGRIHALGDEYGAMWDGYYDLPKGAARDRYREEHPEMTLLNIIAYNPKEYDSASELFTFDEMLGWSRAPRWDGTEATDALRKRYWDENPRSWLVGAWMNGRPGATEFDEKAAPEDYRRNFGADWAEAIERYGDDIWDVVYQYRTLGDGNKRGFYDQFPQYKDWSDWWYGSLPDNGTGTTRSYGAGAPLIRRNFGGGGGGGGGWGGSTEQGQYPNFVKMPEIYGRELDRSLQVWPEQEVRAWRPDWTDTDWLTYAGKELEPERPRLYQWR